MDSPTGDCGGTFRGIGLDTARIPDMTVMLREALLSLQEREAAIDVDLKAPLLVIKVGSPSIKCIEEKAGDKI